MTTEFTIPGKVCNFSACFQWTCTTSAFKAKFFSSCQFFTSNPTFSWIFTHMELQCYWYLINRVCHEIFYLKLPDFSSLVLKSSEREVKLSCFYQVWWTLHNVFDVKHLRQNCDLSSTSWLNILSITILHVLVCQSHRTLHCLVI